MSAEVLRRAAALMRERAEAATADVCPDWTRGAVRHIARNCEIECYHDGAPSLRHHDSQGEPNQWSRYDDAAHIASWHPAVALAVADWLEYVSKAHEDAYISGSHALAVARAYLGDDT